MPTRIIHISVDGQSLKLLGDFNDRAQYIALSYPWGGTIDFITTNKSLNDMFGGFQITALPRTLQDAVFACHQLGVHCWWIDCLCIIQDPPEDKVKEISRMNQVFSNAFCTISPTNALSAHDGFLDYWFQDRRKRTLPCSLPNGSIGTMCLRDLRWYSKHDEPLNQRALTLARGTLLHNSSTSRQHIWSGYAGVESMGKQ